MSGNQDPLFLDDLREKLEEAGSNTRKLLNLRNRMARIRVFDPACGSGNFLVIAYKEMRAIEAEINERRGEPRRGSDIPLTNFRGIELRDFPAEIARLALVIAEYQCNVLHRGQRDALAEFLPLDAMNWITCGNALKLDWLDICPLTGTGVRVTANDLFEAPLHQAEIEFENEGGETYICSNPPYRGSQWKSAEQREDLRGIFEGRTKKWKSLDYVSGWFMKCADYGLRTDAAAALVSTNSICQGRQVDTLWSQILATGHEIAFAHTSFKWANLASHNAGVTVVIVGMSNRANRKRWLFSTSNDGETIAREVDHINPYLVPAQNMTVQPVAAPLNGLAEMRFGNMPNDGGHLLLNREEVDSLELSPDEKSHFIRPSYGSAEFIRGLSRYCLWIEDDDLPEALRISGIKKRVQKVRAKRLASRDSGANALAKRPHQFREMNVSKKGTIIVPRHSSQNRDFLPVGYLDPATNVADAAIALFDAPLWNMALIASRVHLVWIATVCGKLKTDYRYSNTLGWNTFPVPVLTEKNKNDLTACAENILLAREAHFPATIADLYDPERMPENLRAAHDCNDEVLERIYIGRRFRNDTERLEKLFDMYSSRAAPKRAGR